MNNDRRNAPLHQFRDQSAKSTLKDWKLEYTGEKENGLDARGWSKTCANGKSPFLSAQKCKGRIPDAALVNERQDAVLAKGDEVGKRVLTVDELTKMFNVSAKTISRWRADGLVGRPFVIDGRKRLGFLESSVVRFVRENPRRVDRAAKFCHLDDEERRQIIHSARRIIRDGYLPAEVLTRLAKQTGRSRETLRYTKASRELGRVPAIAGAEPPRPRRSLGT